MQQFNSTSMNSVGGRQHSKRKSVSPTSIASLNQAKNMNAHHSVVARASPTFSESSGSLSSSYLESPRRKKNPYTQASDRLESAIQNLSLRRTQCKIPAFISTVRPSFISSSLSKSSSSTSTSYLASPKQKKSRSSNPTRPLSPIKTTNLSTSRHHWLYNQNCWSPSSANEEKHDKSIISR